MLSRYQSCMELRHLRYFQAVGATENFHQAARDLGVAQPALSRQIKALEDELGVKLLERLPRGIRLSEAGKTFLHDSTELIASLEKSIHRARRVSLGEIGTLRIALSEAGSLHPLVPAILGAFKSRYHDVELVPAYLGVLPQIAALRSNQLDVGILQRLETDDLGFNSRIIGRHSFVLAVPAASPLATKAEISVSDLKDQDHIWLSRLANPTFYRKMTAAYVNSGVKPRVVQEVANWGLLLTLVEAGLGVGMVPASLQSRTTRGVILRSLSDLEFPILIEIVWRKDETHPVVRRFLETANAVIENGQ